MPRHLLTVEDAFDITGRGLLVVPGPLVSEYVGPRRLSVTLKPPGGGQKAAILTLEHVFLTPPPREQRWGCRHSEVVKSDVPVGTQIWTE